MSKSRNAIQPEPINSQGPRRSPNPVIPPPPPPIPEGSVGGFPPGSTVTVPDGCVAVVIPFDFEGMEHNVRSHLDVGRLSLEQRSGLKAVATGLDFRNMRLQRGDRVTRGTEAARWILEAISSACNADSEFRRTRTPDPVVRG